MDILTKQVRCSPLSTFHRITMDGGVSIIYLVNSLIADTYCVPYKESRVVLPGHGNMELLYMDDIVYMGYIFRINSGIYEIRDDLLIIGKSLRGAVTKGLPAVLYMDDNICIMKTPAARQYIVCQGGNDNAPINMVG